MASLPGSAAQPSLLSQMMAEAEDAARRGDFPRAYRLSRDVTQINPQNLKAWLLAAETAPSITVAVNCLNSANALYPAHPDAKQQTYRFVQQLLHRDPSILYLDETDELYQVRSGEQLSLLVPKDRSQPQPYPPGRPMLLQSAYRWLALAFLGLPLAGLGAILFAPLAAASAIGLYFRTASRTNRVYSLVVIMLSGGLWLVGLLLGVILLVHLI
jgi:hypothetical protein